MDHEQAPISDSMLKIQFIYLDVDSPNRVYTPEYRKTAWIRLNQIAEIVPVTAGAFREHASVTHELLMLSGNRYPLEPKELGRVTAFLPIIEEEKP